MQKTKEVKHEVLLIL